MQVTGFFNLVCHFSISLAVFLKTLPILVMSKNRLDDVCSVVMVIVLGCNVKNNTGRIRR